MNPADAIAFLRRKHELIVRCTCDPDERAQLLESWAPLFARIAAEEKLSAMQKLDRALEKALKRHVFDWDIDPLRRKLVEEFGLSRLRYRLRRPNTAWVESMMPKRVSLLSGVSEASGLPPRSAGGDLR